MSELARLFGLARGVVCYALCAHMPFASRGIFYRAELALLPYAGDWAYKDCGGRYDRENQP